LGGPSSGGIAEVLTTSRLFAEGKHKLPYPLPSRLLQATSSAAAAAKREEVKKGIYTKISLSKSHRMQVMGKQLLLCVASQPETMASANFLQWSDLILLKISVLRWSRNKGWCD